MRLNSNQPGDTTTGLTLADLNVSCIGKRITVIEDNKSVTETLLDFSTETRREAIHAGNRVTLHKVGPTVVTIYTSSGKHQFYSSADLYLAEERDND